MKNRITIDSNLKNLIQWFTVNGCNCFYESGNIERRSKVFKDNYRMLDSDTISLILNINNN